MRLTWKEFESFIKSRNHDQLQEIILDVAKENKELQKEIYFKFEAIEDFTPQDYEILMDDIDDIKYRLHKSLNRFHRVNKKTLSDCLTSLEEIFKKKVRPVAKQGYYLYTLNLVVNIFYVCQCYLKENPTKRLEKFETTLKSFLFNLMEEMPIEDFIIFFFNLSDWLDKYDIKNLKEVKDKILSDEEKLMQLEKKTQKWLDEHYIDDLTKNIEDNDKYNNIAVFNTYLKNKLGIPEEDMKDRFINCFGVRNFFMDQMFKNKEYDKLIDYSKKVRKLEGLDEPDLESMNLILIDTYKELDDEKHLIEELEYNISTFDQENLEMLAWYLSFFDKSEWEEQAEWFIGSKPFQNHNYNKYFIKQVAENLNKRKFTKISEVELLEYLEVLRHLFPEEIVDYFLWEFEREMKKKKMSQKEYQTLATILKIAANINEEKTKAFAQKMVKQYPGRKYLKLSLVEKGLT